MTLSDEDYGILYNSVEEQKLSDDAYMIMWNNHYEFESIEGPTYDEQQWLGFAAFIILSEGRELP